MLKLGIIVPNYNHAEFLRETLKSIENQTVKPDEVYLIDDNSTDNSISIANSFIGKIKNFKIIKKKLNTGTFDVLNHGLNKINTDFVLFLSSNDLIAPTLVANAKKSLIKNTDIGFWSALTYKTQSNKTTKFLSPLISTSEILIKKDAIEKSLVKYDIWFTGSTTFYNKKYLKKNGGFNQKLHGFADLISSINLAKLYGCIFSPMRLATYRNHENRLIEKTYTNKFILKTLRELNKNFIKNTYDNKLKKLLLQKIFINYLFFNNKYNNKVLTYFNNNNFIIFNKKIFRFKKLWILLSILNFRYIRYFYYRFIKNILNYKI